MARARARADKDELVTVGEVYSRYPDEWVLLEITRDHKHPYRVRGRLLGHSPNRRDLDEPYRRFRTEHPQAQTYEFFTGDVVPKDVFVVL
jgi:hypothetical protein